jgi:hypothetical protein
LEKYSTTIKTLVRDNIFSKTTNRMLTVYYTSYIKTNFPQTTNSNYKQFIYYYVTSETNPAIVISVINSTILSSQLTIKIYKSNAAIHKEYTIRKGVPKVKTDLTVDLATARP